MSLYFLLGTLTTDGQRMLHDDRNLVIKATRGLRVNGAEILGQYAVLGGYDFIMMVDAEDNEAVASVSLELGMSTGMHLETMPAIAMGFLTETASEDPREQLLGVERSQDDRSSR